MNAQPTKQQVISLLRAWIKQRPGLDPADYGFPAYSHEAWKEARRSYNAEARSIAKDKQDAETLLNAVEYSGMDAETLLGGFRAYSGRLEIKPAENGEFRLEYCTGQYWPTEYRAAACAVLASALWDYHRPDYENDDRPGDSLRAMFRRRFGRGIQSRWLD